MSGRARLIIAAALALLSNFFGAIFWFVEQRRSRLVERLENERFGNGER